MSIIENLFSKQIQKAVRKQLTVLENENTFLIGTRSASQSDRDRYSYDRNDVLTQALDAWRTNPLARRIVELTSQYVVGGGLEITSKNKSINKFIQQFWNHRLNRMPIRVYEMCDELTRTGNLFILISTDSAGMSYIRVIPTQNIDQIESTPNDIEQPIVFQPKADISDLGPKPYSAYDDQNDDITKVVMLQYTINRPSGAQWGEPDLAPLLRWLSRYSNWLEDRVRLNRFRNAFLYIVSAKFASETQRKARQQTLNATPPQPGSILVTDENETWDTVSPRLESRDASTDGLAIKKMIASGAGVPMHFLAEPESATRTTAEAAGGPTYRRFQQRQEYFIWLLNDILNVVCARRALVDPNLRSKVGSDALGITIQAADISTADNITLAMAAGNILPVLQDLRDRLLIDNNEYLRLVYRFTGETVDIEEMLERGKSMETNAQGSQPKTNDGANDHPGGNGKNPSSDPYKLSKQVKGEPSAVKNM